MRPKVLSAFVLILAACGPATPPAEPPPAPTAAPSASASAAPDPSAQPAATASAEAELPEGPSPFFPSVVHGAGSLRFYAMGKVGFAIDGDYLSRPIRIDEAGARIDPHFYDGLKGETEQNAFFVFNARGDWPRSGSIAINLPGERGGTDVNYTWSGSTWVKAAEQPFAGWPEEAVASYYNGGFFSQARWGSQSLLYLIGYEAGSDVPYPRFVVTHGGKPPVVTPGGKGCKTRLVGYGVLTNLASGDLIGLGKLCTGGNDASWMTLSGPGALAIESWPNGKTTSTVTELPGTAGKGDLRIREGGLLEVSPTERYLFTTFHRGEGDAQAPYVTRWDGKGWRDVSPDVAQGATAMWRAKDGTVWLQLQRTLLRRKGDAWDRVTPDRATGDIAWTVTAPDETLWTRIGQDLWHLAAGGWERASLPRADGVRLVAESVAWAGGEMIVVAHDADGKTGMLLSSRKPAKVLDLEAEGAPKDAGKKVAFGHVGPPTAGCKSLFAVLYKLSRVAPKDYDFPLTREALKGHTELSDVRFAETEDGGARYLVGFVPSVKKGQKLVALVQEKVKGSRPQLLCGEPQKINREIGIDLRTGALKK